MYSIKLFPPEIFIIQCEKTGVKLSLVLETNIYLRSAPKVFELSVVVVFPVNKAIRLDVIQQRMILKSKRIACPCGANLDVIRSYESFVSPKRGSQLLISNPIVEVS